MSLGQNKTHLIRLTPTKIGRQITMANANDQMLRQWTMLQHIPRFPQKITSRHLLDILDREGFSVSKRMVERDLQALSDRFPITSDEREKPYGWSWQKDAPAFDVPGLSASEALTFKLAEQYLSKLMPTGMLEQLRPYFDSADQALARYDKRSNLAKWPEKIAVAYPNQPLLPSVIQPEIAALVDEALLEERQIEVSYRPKGESDNKVYTLHPLGLVLRGPVSYLLATIYTYQDVCLFAMHRFESVKVLNEPSKRPAGFVLNDFVQSGKLGFNHYGTITLELQFSAGAGAHLYETPLSSDQTIAILPSRALSVTATVQDNSQLRWWIRGFGDEVSVISPQPLRDWFLSENPNT